MTLPYNGMKPIHPGEILRDWLDDLDMSAASLSQAIHISEGCVTSILSGTQDITGDTALRLSRYFSTTPQFWLNLQKSYSLKHAEAEEGLKILDLVIPRKAKTLQLLAANLLKTNEKIESTQRTLINVLANNVAVCEQVIAASGLLIDQSYKNDIKVPRTLACVLDETRPAMELDLLFEGYFKDVEKCLLIYEKQFKLPSPLELSSIISQFNTNESHSVSLTDALAKTLKSMQSCWLQQENANETVQGFHDLHRLSELITSDSFRDEEATCEIREILGDWRNTIRWPLPMWTDLTFRADQYESHGFRPTLTDLPSTAFYEAIEKIGLCQKYPAPITHTECPSDSFTALSPKVALPRTIRAFEEFQMFESKLREYIDRVMSVSFGSNWPKKQIPTTMYDKWRSRQERSQQVNAMQNTLVAYADFSDHLDIFCVRDNWQSVFRSFFYRQEDIRESFQRLYPISQDTLYKRPVTLDDELLLLIESKRILRQIRKEL